MRLKHPFLLACLLTSAAQAADIENACFNCPPLDKVADATSTKDNTLTRKASVTKGDTEEPIDILGQCLDQATFINKIQGDSDASPLLGEAHVIEGVVTAVFSNLNGFFIQEELADQDKNSATSEGLFVYNKDNTVAPMTGDVVRVAGDVAEFQGKTQLAASEDLLICGTSSVEATTLSLPFASAESAEALEGMLITIDKALTVTDNYNLARYGEVTLSNGRLYVPSNLHQPGTTAITELAAQNALNKITLDDGVNGQNPVNIIYPTGGLTALNSLRMGDSVSSLIGVMDYSLDNYRVIPTQSPTFGFTNARTSSPKISKSGNLRVASFNVLNYFNGDGLGGGYPTSRGADNAKEFVRQRAKVIAAITIINADIIGLLEMENDGFGENSAIQDLVNGLNAVAPVDVHYSFVNPHIPADAGSGIEILGGDHIKVAMIYNDKAVTEFGIAAYITAFPFEYHNRPPMAQTFRANETGERLTVAINHFRSKGCSSSGGVENENKNDGQGCYNLRRVQAAEAITTWLAQYPTGIEDNDILIIGDLNAYSKEDPVTTIQNAGYTNLAQTFIGDTAYSYAYRGEIGALDHALASTTLSTKVLDMTEWHINADEPRALDYNTEYQSDNKIVSLYNDDAYRASDHDPVVIEIEGVTPLISVKKVHTDLGTNARWSTFEFEVPATSVSFTATISGGEGNVDLYVRKGKKPNIQKFDCRSQLAGNEETCKIEMPSSGTWYIRLRGDRHYSDVSLTLEAMYPEPIN